MKWLSVALEIAVIVYNHVTGKGKRDLAQEIEIAQGMVKKLTSNMTPEEKGEIVLDVVGNLKAVKKFRTRVSKKIGKAGDRVVNKFF